MKTSEQTIQQIQRAIRKICQKFPADSQNTPITDIHIRVYQETGELLAFDDDDNEITRCVIEQWIENKDDNFYQDVAEILRKQLQEQQETIDQLNISKPFSLVLEDDEKKTSPNSTSPTMTPSSSEKTSWKDSKKTLTVSSNKFSRNKRAHALRNRL